MGGRAGTAGSGYLAMNCLTCAHLEQLYESRLSKYRKLRSGAFYQFSTELAARKEVDMERAKNDLEEHQMICPLRDPEKPTRYLGSIPGG